VLLLHFRQIVVYQLLIHQLVIIPHVRRVVILLRIRQLIVRRFVGLLHVRLHARRVAVLVASCTVSARLYKHCLHM
jgi:hypothetical protein